ncbi:MAG: ATP-grasp domain-containing protein, partial [Stomatobaculum longum]|nr:ATP-grasp domain-containing protein [Stomatobaculum longum]
RHMPLILKPDNGRSSEGVFRIGNREALTRALLELRMLGRAEGYLAQPFISGRVVCVDTIRDSAGHTLALAREEYIRTPRGAGLSVQVFRDSELEAICGALAAELGVIGCVNFEFIKDAGGKYHFLECNPRFSGGIGFSERAGLPAVRLHLGAWRGESIPEDITERITPGWQVKKYIEVVTKE